MEIKKLTKVNLIFGYTDVDYFKVLEDVIKKDPNSIINEIIDSGLKGRGGAGFPTGLKWKFAKEQVSDKKYVVCNADEGEPGTFKDREIIEKVPEKILVGMAICAYCIGADEGYIYLRGEYEYLAPQFEKKIEEFVNKLKTINFNFKITLYIGCGAYVCGEETALFESIEGRRGEARNKPPFPTVAGLFNKPTVINNVETFVYTTMICKLGVNEFKKYGTQDSRGSKVFSVSGDTLKPGIYELELGMKVKDFVEEFGDGDTKAVQIGGASGICIPRKDFDNVIIGFEGVPTGGSIMLFNSKRSMFNVLHNFLEFFCEESCGQCTPCRVGYQQLLKGIEAVKKGEKPASYLNELKKLALTMKIASKCGLGQSAANPFLSIVDNFIEEFIY